MGLGVVDRALCLGEAGPGDMDFATLTPCRVPMVQPGVARPRRLVSACIEQLWLAIPTQCGYQFHLDS